MGPRTPAPIVVSKSFKLGLGIALLAIAAMAPLALADWRREPLEQVSTRMAITAIEGYQHHLSGEIPFIHCRFVETCSEYSKRVLREHGFPEGIWLTFLRLCNCM